MVLLCRADALPGAFQLIFSCALSPRAAAGGGAGWTVASALRYGVARGVFSNEAGLGPSAMAHGAAAHACPVRQGFWGMFEVVLATLLVSMGLGLMIADIMLPVVYQLGPERARPWMYVIIFAPIVVLLGGAKLGLFDGIDLSWLDQLPELAVLGVFALVPLVPLVGMLLSCWISCRIYARKEF